MTIPKDKLPSRRDALKKSVAVTVNLTTNSLEKLMASAPGELLHLYELVRSKELSRALSLETKAEDDTKKEIRESGLRTCADIFKSIETLKETGISPSTNKFLPDIEAYAKDIHARLVQFGDKSVPSVIIKGIKDRRESILLRLHDAVPHIEALGAQYRAEASEQLREVRKWLAERTRESLWAEAKKTSTQETGIDMETIIDPADSPSYREPILSADTTQVMEDIGNVIYDHATGREPFVDRVIMKKKSLPYVG